MKFRTSIIASCRCLSPSCLRAGAVRMALAMVLALLVVPGYIVAPILFAQLDSAAQAGQLAGLIFHTSNRGILLLLVAIALFWRGRSAGRVRWLLWFVLLILLAINEGVLAPMMQQMKEAMGSIEALAPDAPERATFAMWHGVSAVVHLLASLLALVLVTLGWSGRSISAGEKTACKG